MSDAQRGIDNTARDAAFRRIVEPYIPEGSGLAEIDIIDAIIRGKILDVIERSPSDRVLDAVACLTTIYDELEKDEPDYDFIKQTAEQMRNTYKNWESYGE